MNLQKEWNELEAVRLDMEMHAVFDIFRRNRSSLFHPVVDKENRPIGIIREHDLKNFAYARFGRELITREPLKSFIRPSLVLPDTVSRDELLNAVMSNPNPDGIVITSAGIYRAVLCNNVIIRIFEDNRVETHMRLVQSQKMEAIGTLAGGIAHDLNNILTPIVGYAELMLKMLAAKKQVDCEMLEQILVSGKRAQESVGRITAFSRYQKSEQQVISIAAIIREVLRLIGNSLPTTIETRLRIATDHDMVFANPTELHQVIMNLCTNAYHAMREHGGQLQVSLADHNGPPLGWSLYHGALPSPVVRLTVSDTGTGISEENLPKIFEPFFTTKPQGEGTGLGLAIVHGIVSRCKGMLSVESVLGQGTAMHVYLPRHATDRYAPEEDSHIEKMMPPAQPPNFSGGKQNLRVMYVDDEYQVARMAKQYLSFMGLEVAMENDSVKAWSILERSLNDYDILITDQVMPSLSGIDLAQRVLKLNPKFPVIICTGFNDVITPEKIKALGLRGYLHKPPDFTRMAELIRKSCVQ